MGIHNFGARFPHGKPTPGWIDWVGGQSTAGVKGEVDTFTFQIPGKYRRVILLGIGIGGCGGAEQNYQAGGGGGAAAKSGLILPQNDILTITMPRSSYTGTLDTSFDNYTGPSLIVSSAALGTLMTVGAGQNGKYSSPAGVGGIAALNRTSDFSVQNGGTYAGGAGMPYTGDYSGSRATAGTGYSAGGGAGSHGNLGGLHGSLQTSAAFIASLSSALKKYGASTYQKTNQGGASWSTPNSGANSGVSEPKSDVSFGGGTGGGSGQNQVLYPGRSFFRIAFGLLADGGNINPANTGW